jgi:hypothetical protein
MPCDVTPPPLAILIDGENVSAACWPRALAIAKRFGVPAIVRAYFCHPPTPGWSAAGIEIVDGRPADGPNAADFLMAMDAAVMAAERQVTAFALLTGDDGFAAVAQGLQRRGAFVVALIPFNGCGIPKRLARTADLSVLVPLPVAAVPAPRIEAAAAPPNGGAHADNWTDLVRAALTHCAGDDDGWTDLSALGSILKKSTVKAPKGKLSVIIREVSGVEIRGAGTKIQVRPQAVEPPPELQAAIPGLFDARAPDDEIPF